MDWPSQNIAQGQSGPERFAAFGQSGPERLAACCWKAHVHRHALLPKPMTVAPSAPRDAGCICVVAAIPHMDFQTIHRGSADLRAAGWASEQSSRLRLSEGQAASRTKSSLGSANKVCRSLAAEE